MINLIAIATAVAATLVAGLIFYAFRARQLYLLIPRMFAHGELIGRPGKIVELQALNRGRAMEEDVRIAMPAAPTYHLLAADSPDVQLEGSTLLLSRLPARTDVSMIILVEGAEIGDDFSATLSSRATKGAIFRKLDDIPPNWGSLLIAVAVIFGVLAVGFYWLNLHIAQERPEEARMDCADPSAATVTGASDEVRSKQLAVDGWAEVGSFLRSTLGKSYNDHEFPASLAKVKRSGNLLSLEFILTNKSTNVFLANAYVTTDKEREPDEFGRADPIFLDGEIVDDLRISPMTSKSVLVTASVPRDVPFSSLAVQMSLTTREEFVYFSFRPMMNAMAKRAIENGEAKP